MAKNANKLVGTQYLDLTRLRGDVAETQKLLKSIGTGVNLNMTDVVEKQVKQMLASFKKEIQNAAQNASAAGKQMGGALKPATTQIQNLMTLTQRLNADGSLTETRKGYDALGHSITEVYRNGQLLNKSLTADSSLNKDIQYANKLYQEQIGYLKKVYQLKTQRLTVKDGTPTAQHLDSQIADTQRQIDANNQLIALLDKEALQRSKLKNLSAEEGAIASKYLTAQIAQQEKLNAAKLHAASGLPELKQVQQAYQQLTTSYRQYITAVKNGNTAGQAYWSQSAQAAMQEIQLIESKLPSLTIEEDVRKKILNLIQQAKNAEATHQKTLNDINQGASKLDESLDRIGSRLIQMATTMLILRGLTSVWRNATDFAQQYYDKLNEIRIVTGKSEKDVARLGQSYRTLAKEMNVSATEIAVAAVEFWRQGQDEDEVNARLTSSIRYAKISSLEFDEAAQLITAATNTMNVSAQRVVDVFAYLGDASASGPDEIGVAMQKASASAVEFGQTFEWLGAYIATISEQTRQAPEVIGTSINSIMARLHSIKAKGYSEEDETKINDVAKALGTIDVALMDNAGNWRAMSDIFSDIAAKWDTLDSKTKSYIATTMAGTRQQNYFLALMNDMAKGVEGGSRAYELYAGAMNAAGTATQKYAIWQESVTAAQNRLTAAMQSFYALLDADWMKGFYDGMAGLVEIITAGTDALGGWNLLIPAVAAGLTALIAVVFKAVTAMKAMKTALAAGAAISTVLSGGTIAAIVAGVAALASVVTMLSGAAAMASEIEQVDYSNTIHSVSSYKDTIDTLVTELETLATKTDLTAEEQARADEIMRTLSGTSLSMKSALENGGDGFDTLGEKAAAARGEVEKTEQALRALNAADALQNLRDADNSYAQNIASAQTNLNTSNQYGDFANAFQSFMQEHPTGLYTQSYSGPHGTYGTKEETFYTYAKKKAEQPKPIWLSQEEKARIQADRDFWAGVVAEMEALGIDYTSSVEEISNKMLEFNIAAGSYAQANQQRLDEAWQPVFSDLYTVMTDGSQFSALPSFMQEAAIAYYKGFVGAVDKQAELAEGDLMAMAAHLTGYVDKMAGFVEDNADFGALIGRFDELLKGPRTQETVDELNVLLPLINEYITAYNALTVSTEDDIPLIPLFTLESLQELDAAEEAVGKMTALQKELEESRKLANAANAIDPSKDDYDPIDALSAYELLEGKYAELTGLQRGSVEYLQRACELTDETTAAVYRQAEAYGIVTDIQAKSAQYAAGGKRERKFQKASDNSYEGGVAFLENAVTQAEASGEDVAQAWNDALSELDEAGVLAGMAAMFGDISTLAIECGGNVEQIIARLHEMRTVAQEITLSDMASGLRAERELNQSETNGYQKEVDAQRFAFGDGGTEGVQKAMAVWNGFDASIQQSIAETYPSQVIALDDANQAAETLAEGFGEMQNAEGAVGDEAKAAQKRVSAFGDELEAAHSSASARHFKNTARAIEELKHGAISVADAFDDYNAEAEKAAKANEEYQAASRKMASGTEVAADEIRTLGELLGNIDPAILLANWDMVGPMLSAALAEGEAAFHRLNEAAFITITGTSVADFSALTSGLISVQNLAADAIDALIATGQWQLEMITLPQEGAQWNPVAGIWTRTRINTNQHVLRYTGNNPLKSSGRSSSGKSSSGGGSRSGGGSGASSNTVSKTTQRALDAMEEVIDNSDHRRNMAQLAQQYHETRGELQGVILYLNKERDIVEKNSATLEGYVRDLEAQIDAQRAVLTKHKEGSSQYRQAMLDLEALQERHKQYSAALLENKNDLETLQKAIKEQNDAIREMEIDLRETIHEAILDREALNQRMLEGRIDLENELIDVLTRRYEKERDELLEIAQFKHDTLTEELDLLEQEFEARKKLHEQQEEAQELAELEEQLARISADPTRKKEELALREEIAELREKLAWDLAEEEVEAQKESIESQIESIDDYIEYVQNYYEEVLSNPRKLIEELQELLTKTDAEIIAWLEKNHEDYQVATDAAREDMRLGWQSMLDDMRGHTQTFWDEVESIISQGDAAIIDFLKANSADYREAGALQAEAYVDAWQKKLDDLRNALKQVQDQTNNYTYTPTYTNNTSSSSSSSSSSSKPKTKKYKATYPDIGTVKGGTLKGYATEAEALQAAQSKINAICRQVSGTSSSMVGYWARSLYSKIKVTAYAKGGLNDTTGLAWLDGTKAKPERILNPYQTELFEDLLKTLHAIRTYQTPASIVQPRLMDANSQQTMTIENITVQVERLDSEQDYEEMAERVGEQIMEKVARGMTVGGIRMG